MEKNDLIKKINSDDSAKIFNELYGENEVKKIRRRYANLIEEMQNDNFPKAELCNTEGDLRVFSASGRTELAGNHTDHNRGKVIATSIQLDSIAIVQKRNDNIVFFRSTGFPDVKVNLTDSAGNHDLQSKPEEAGKTEALVRGIAAELNRRGRRIGGFTANVDSTVLPGSGLSSSAAVEVLIGKIFDSLYSMNIKYDYNYDEDGDKLEALSPLELAQIGQIAENVYFGKPCGLMDQTACATGGAVAIDFADTANPVVKQINFDLEKAGYALCVVNTGGSHADLTDDYASIPAEMKKIAAYFGKSVLRELEKETVLKHSAELRKVAGDRALLRSLHFFDENIRVDAITTALQKIETAATGESKQEAMQLYLDLINESGDSSWELLQNVYTTRNPESQGITTALALTRDFFSKNKYHGACRVHGGGFAGTIQTYIPLNAINAYRACMEPVFGTGSVTELRIRPKGAIELFF